MNQLNEQETYPCLECGYRMFSSTRQLCGKTQCDYLAASVEENSFDQRCNDNVITIGDIKVHNNPYEYVNMYLDFVPLLLEDDHVSLWNGLGETYLIVRHTQLSAAYNIKNGVTLDRELFFIGRLCDHTFTPTESREYVFFQKKYVYCKYLKE